VRGEPPARLGDALGAWLDKAGLARRIDLARAVSDWAAAVGPQVAAVTRAEAVNAEGTLWVRVASSAWANELSLMAPRILAKLNQNRRGRIKEIRWLTGLAQPEPHQGGER
jgi:predicted nucleic acid-binding Zn ribbon protein